MSAVSVWRAEPHEAQAVTRLLIAFRDHIGRDWPHEDVFGKGIEKLLTADDCDFLLAARAHGASAEAVCQLRYHFSVWRDGQECILEDLYVDEQARRAGLGAALVAGALQRARERDCRWIELDTYEDNAPALALYESHGFRVGRSGNSRDVVLSRRLEL
jgi:ribosomal protein S18 acetylase RimI-like enzyme